MATGAEYFRRFLSLLRTLEIEPGDESTYCEKTKKIYLSQDTGFYITLDNKFETILSKKSNTITFLHELNHYIHENSQQFNEIYQNAIQTIETMHTKYEEGTISGFLHLKKTLLAETVDQRIYHYCCENTARLELNLPIRVSHSGAFNMKKGDSFIIRAISYGYKAYLERLMNADTTNKETKLERAAALGQYVNF